MDNEQLNKLKLIGVDILTNWLEDDFIIRKCKKDNLANNIYELYNLDTTNLYGWGEYKKIQLRIVKDTISENIEAIINSFEKPQRGSTETNSTQLEIYDKLKDIPIEELYYVSLDYDKDYTGYEGKSLFNYYTWFKDRDIKTVGDFYILSPEEYLTYGSVGKSKVERFKNEKILIENNVDRIIAQWKEYNSKTILPHSNPEGSCFYDILLQIIKDILVLLDERQNQTHYKKSFYSDKKDRYNSIKIILSEYFLQEKSLEEIGQVLGITRERCRQILATIHHNIFFSDDLSDLFANWNNVSISPTFKEINIETNGLWLLEEDFTKRYGNIPDVIMNFLNLDVVGTGNISIIVPKDMCTLYSSVLKQTIYTLRDNCITPLTRDEIVAEVYSRVNEGSRYGDCDCDYEENIIDTILDNDDFVSKGDNDTFLIKEHLLETNIERVARIVYNSPSPMSTEAILQTFESKYGFKPTANISNVNKNIHYSSAGWYIGEERMSIIKRIALYAKNKIIFTTNEIKECLIGEGYTWEESKESTYRTYITQLCSTDNKDENHFCLKGWTVNYPEYSWRKPAIHGVSNWMLKKINEYIGKAESCKIKDVIKFLKSESKVTIFSSINFENNLYNIGHINRNRTPFIIEGDEIKKNYPYYKSINFDYIGLKGGQYPHYIQIRNAASNVVKSCKDYRIKLTEFMESFNNTLSETIPRGTFIRAIENDFLETIPVCFQTINNDKYLVYTGDSTKSEPIYKISIENNTKTINTIADNSDRKDISYLLEIDWNSLAESLQKELAYSEPYFQKNNLDFVSSIDLFVEYLKGESNTNLNYILPKNLFEYWNANTDLLDRVTYLNNLCLFYKPLIKTLRFNYNMISSDYFSNIKHDLFEKRELCVDGEPLELTSSQIAQSICDYTTLYIYTIALCMKQ